ncbi:ankyrin repeat domain-containing protein [Pedobacter sp. ASV28]|uniref:ankyrin repeat domain-containing protein n=1 Tax=Pedobacter sp. ASV28 TaxID=2795123 RepID=UPI0018EE38AF
MLHYCLEIAPRWPISLSRPLPNTATGKEKRPEKYLLNITYKNLTHMELEKEMLIHAARIGNIAVLEELIKGDADLNQPDPKGYTPLIIACYNHQFEAAKLLIAHGADPNASDQGGNTALMGAAFKGYADIAELLLANGAALDLQHGNGGTALMFAAMFGRNELVKLLLLHGADSEICDARGMRAADLALQQGNIEAVELLGQPL